jgi:hypothetical protein
MSLRSPHAVVIGTEGHECRLARVLGAGQQQQIKAKTTQRQLTRTSVDQCIDAAIRRAGHSSRMVPTSSVVLSILGPPTPKPPVVAANIDRLSDQFSHLKSEEDTDVNTGKRKVDGSLAAARVGQTTTERWANERFRQVMLLVLEFRKEWQNNSLLTADDVESIRTALDGALFVATNSNAVADIYDLNATVWAIYLVQWAHTKRVGGWTVESAAAQQRMSFQTLYKWLEGRHSLHQRHDLRDSLTKKIVHKYVLPFKRMKIPPDTTNMFKFRKGANRLSDWIVRGSVDGQAVGLAAGIIEMQPPALVAPPPSAAVREARANVAWARGRTARQRRSTLRSVVGNSEDAQDTRRVVDAVIQASGTYSTSDSDDELAEELEREMEAEEGDGAGPSEGGGMALQDIQRILMDDSGDEDAAEADHENDEGGSGGDGGALPAGGSELSEYEKERQEKIARNKARLQELGLDDPLVPPRPRPAPKQPRPPRAPDGPRRESNRLQGVPRPRYADMEKSDEEEDEEDETPHVQTDEPPPQQVQGQPSGDQEPQQPRRSTRVVDSSERGSFSEQTRAAIKVALSTSTLQGTGLELVHFMSATQLPRDRITGAGVRGDAEELDRREGSHLILVSLKIRDFLSQVLNYRPAVLWKWIGQLQGLDVTALLYRGEVIGATIGFYSEEEHVYLTHMTATHRSLQGGVGVGLFLRRQQLQHLQQRLRPGHGPLEVVSLSANRDGENRGAVQFQRHIFTQRLGFEELQGALPIIQRIAEATPELGLGRIMRQGVTPLRFRQILPPPDL